MHQRRPPTTAPAVPIVVLPLGSIPRDFVWQHPPNDTCAPTPATPTIQKLAGQTLP
ncbi:hypothetical protein FH972_004324 [Carpinus fangiana]|uniref:Uncharacterized protein n=1 Tax=Carpinus fangiana TaxID=176857 RepID=A0A5N6QKX6_9ROSI|nr:hypothetical protein FH972_004324 [Carpinus fangiana]